MAGEYHNDDSASYAVAGISQSLPMSNCTRGIMALSDNGASFRSHCCRTTDGAVLDTFRPPDSSGVGLGSKAGELVSLGSYIYVFERFGSDGSSDLVARRCKYTPDLRCPIVFSEPTEVKLHHYKYAHGYSGVGRCMVTELNHR